MNTDTSNQMIFNYGAVYTPFQCMKELFDADDSLAYGTVFPELVDEYTKYLR